MELLLIFFNSFMVGFSGAMMPGPLLAVGIAETPRHGWKTGPVISIGHAIAEIAVVVVLLLGLVAVAKNPLVVQIIGVVGGVMLIVMGIMMGYDILKGKIKYNTDESAKKSNHKLAGKGITATFSNPYWFVWWSTIGLALLVNSLEYGLIGPVVFYFGHILSDFVWFTFVSVILWTGKKLIMGNVIKILITFCALFLIYLGTTFVYNGLSGSIIL
ncbi:MAG: LysE family transporter [candidate division Zixibacteria bacterium]|nr:LysE family transporter [candidate division Zixibacteria bacterium]